MRSAQPGDDEFGGEGAEVGDGFAEALVEGNHGFPA